MDQLLIDETKKKKEFSKLPDSIIKKVAKDSADIKEIRASLRKYFGVFLTNRVIKAKGSPEEILKVHISTKKREYSIFYRKIFEGYSSFSQVIDLGCGVNGYSFFQLQELIDVKNYLGVEASGQIVNNLNDYFKSCGKSDFARVVWGDIFNLSFLKEIISNSTSPRVIFLFQVIDALESMERDFSKKLLLFLKELILNEDLIVLTLPIESLSGRTNFAVRRKWLLDFLVENFSVEKDFLLNGERIICIKN